MESKAPPRLCDLSRLPVTEDVINLALVASGVRPACIVPLPGPDGWKLLLDGLERAGFEQVRVYLERELLHVSAGDSGLFVRTLRPKDDSLLQCYLAQHAARWERQVRHLTGELPDAKAPKHTCRQCASVPVVHTQKWLGRLLGYATPFECAKRTAPIEDE